MKNPRESNENLSLMPNAMECQQCGAPMQKVSWRITAGAFDAGREVEQTVFQCGLDKSFVSVEVSTGNPSEFAASDELFFGEEL